MLAQVTPKLTKYSVERSPSKHGQASENPTLVEAGESAIPELIEALKGQLEARRWLVAGAEEVLVAIGSAAVAPLLAAAVAVGKGFLSVNAVQTLKAIREAGVLEPGMQEAVGKVVQKEDAKDRRREATLRREAAQRAADAAVRKPPEAEPEDPIAYYKRVGSWPITELGQEYLLRFQDLPTQRRLCRACLAKGTQTILEVRGQNMPGAGALDLVCPACGNKVVFVG